MTEPVAQPSILNERMLLRELNHRINNDFNSATYVILFEAVRSENVAVKHALNDVVHLLHQYTDVHQALNMPDQETLIDAADYLQELCLSVTRSKLTPLVIHLVFAADPLLLQSDRCWRLGLIVNELLTNVARHAHIEVGAGEVRVELKDAGTFVRWKVSDNGFAHDLAASLGGRIHLSLAKGSSFLLAFPFIQQERHTSPSTNQVAPFAARHLSRRVHKPRTNHMVLAERKMLGEEYLNTNAASPKP